MSCDADARTCCQHGTYPGGGGPSEGGPASLLADDLRARRAMVARLESRSRLVAWARLAAFLLGVAALATGGRRSDPLLVVTGIVILAGFAALVVLHGALKNRSRRGIIRAAIDEEGLARIQGRWDAFADRGDEFQDPAHPCARDLDLFGTGSLFQKICAARTRIGREHLAALLRGDGRDRDAAMLRQGAARELAPQLELRHALEAAVRDGGAERDPSPLLAWAEGPAVQVPRWAGASLLLPAAIVGIGTVEVLLSGWIAWALAPCVVLLLSYVSGARRRLRLLQALDGRSSMLASYAESFELLVNHRFEAPVLARIGSRAEGAIEGMRELRILVDRGRLRHNVLAHFFVNLLWPWDLRWEARLAAWKARHGRLVRGWLEALGEFEALSSLAGIAFENPRWSFPRLVDGARLEARDLRHPLLPSDAAVGNDIAFAGGCVVVVTGSNMSGKSTLLRSIGLGAVLAYAGGPVCAGAMSIGGFEVFTSMRGGDDTRSGRSTFLAELERIATMLDAMRNGRPLLFLIDEIFSGTNSRDRTEGALETLRAMRHRACIGFVSTHDLELCMLGEEDGAGFPCHHFVDGCADGELCFDFKLRPGPSTTRNAMFLLRRVGIVA